jgi:hypothetical protein
MPVYVPSSLSHRGRICQASYLLSFGELPFATAPCANL